MQTHDIKKEDIDFEALGKRLGWAEHEISHARDSFQQSEDGYNEECVIATHSGRELRSPAYPAPMDYVRIAQRGFELSYWTIGAVNEDADLVLGALMGGLKNGVEPAELSDEFSVDQPIR